MDDKVELDEELKRVQLKLLRKKGITEEGVAAYNRLTTGGDVARPATDPEQRDEEKKKMLEDALGVLKTEISEMLAALVTEHKKASETIASREKNILEKIEPVCAGVDANTKALADITSEVASFGAKMKNMEHRINVNTATLCRTVPGFMKEHHGSENNAPVANASGVAPEAATPTQTTNQHTGKKNKKKAQTHVEITPTVTETTATKKGAKCRATKKENGEPCDKRARDGFLTCGYHKDQEEPLRKTILLQHVDSTASFQDTATNAQAPSTAQPSVAPRKSSRLKQPGVATRKRKRGEEELEHNHPPDEIGEDCLACLQGATLTQGTEQVPDTVFDEGGTAFDTPRPSSPEHQFPHGLTPQNDGPIPPDVPSPTSEEASRLDQYVRKDVQAELMEYSQQQSQHKSAGQQPTKPGTGPERCFKEPHRGNAGSPWR